MKCFVLDTFAILAFYANEPGADFVRELLLQSSSGEIKLLMSTVNLGEVWYIFNRNGTPNEADQVTIEIQGMKIEIVVPDWKQTRQAAVFKTKGNISYADCFAASLAKIQNAVLVTGDKEFKKLESEITVSWL